MSLPIPRLDEARRALAPARFVLVLTGAGISAESGVPTFRGSGGYWRQRDFRELATPEAFAADPRLVWDWYLERRATIRACSPNAAHAALAQWAGAGEPVVRLVTQNVDGLHERAGHRDVVRFHGSLWHNRCTACGVEREDTSLAHGTLPASPCCNAPERPAVVWFGEGIPDAARTAADEAAARADAVLVIGTAGAVYPAAALVERAAAHGAALIEINPDEDYGIGTKGIFGGIWLHAPAGHAVPALLAR